MCIRSTCWYICWYRQCGRPEIPTNQLSDAALRGLKPRDAPFKVSDGGGLHVLVQPTGGRLWRLAYRFAGKQKTLALGAYPALALAQARQARDAAKAELAAGRDPGALKQAEKRHRARAPSRTFESVAARWFAARKTRWVSGYAGRVWGRVRDDLISQFGDQPIEAIGPDQVLAALRRIEGRGAIETAHRVRGYAFDIFRYARAERLIVANPAADLDDALAAPPPPKHRTALKARDLPAFLDALEAGSSPTSLALKLALLTIVRTSELRFAAWAEFEELSGPEPLWRIPAERMKMRNPHLVPLSRQAVELLGRLRRRTSGDLLFPARSAAGVISANTMIFALYRMGYHGRATVHGFRGTASTILNEQGFNRDWIERQLAHVERDQVRAAYNSAEWLQERRTMMQWWADYLALQTGVERPTSQLAAKS